MPIEIERLDGEDIVIMRMIGFLTNEDITNTITLEVTDRVKDKPDMHLHAIYDVTDFEWTFTEFINYIKQKPSSQANPVAGAVSEHFVGTSQWVNQLRTWWQKQLGKQTTAFTSIDDALNYIRTNY